MVRVRRYGTKGPWVIVLHGGPGAPGYMAPIARELQDEYRILEPLQRGSGQEPLTVARHVADLHEVVGSCDSAIPPALAGSSWGAMLALAYAAEHSDTAGPLVLVGCGTFDAAAREQMRRTVDQRTPPALRRRLDHLAVEFPDPNQRLRAMGDLLLPLYSYDLEGAELEVECCDAAAYEQTWRDMVRLQDEGVYPAAFRAIRTPVLLLHGAADPHPGRMIRAGLEPWLPRLEYVEWERCGHYPWLEKHARDEFFAVLRSWLRRHLAG